MQHIWFLPTAVHELLSGAPHSMAAVTDTRLPGAAAQRDALQPTAAFVRSYEPQGLPVQYGMERLRVHSQLRVITQLLLRLRFFSIHY